ncbi:conserved hypothetical protein [Candida dubliniensis CD36]|uniref:HPP transmembrane region domain-containing protein n=1 Tax=Candida dubliniensis (strain CD36 / ATCC MYA-646 / CBS 7987 / NCPF 3949 / NRRL Y-17841) TaxID=573826 RepID=B9WJG2_CANDC|nr:conserved hypothetical protein [Candida dubliniensis CD36]CAX40604.1 conserved hypothetical protein [Candida dubliniensis CD36]
MVFKFTIDNVLNKYIPRNRLSKLPAPIARLLGAHKDKPAPDYFIWLEILIGSFAGVALLEGVFKSPNIFRDSHHAPMILASYGASAILCFNASQVPLAQPRNVLVGHFIASLIGVCIQKLFSLSKAGQEHYWASGALSVAVSSVVMSIGNCVHPPAGASALLPSIDEQVREMSWWFLPVQLVSSVLILSVACITGNVIRRYPVYWWTPADLGGNKRNDLESSIEEETREKPDCISIEPGAKTIFISSDKIVFPEELDLGEIDMDWLDGLKLKLKQLED